MILISKDSKGKIRCVNIWSEFTKPTYTIYRRTFQFGGKITEQPDIIIEKGKASRSILEQCDLELNSRIKKYLDKGYKEYLTLTKIPFDKITTEEITNLISNEATDQNGALKPMLAKDFNKCATSALERDFLGSRKIDGVRMMIRLEDGVIKSSSRGGKHYDFVIKHIIEKLKSFFEDNPNIILDGELYIPGRSLQYISGVARTEKEDPRTDDLEYWIYDFINLDKMDMPFEFREDELNNYEYNYFGENTFYNESSIIKFVPHVKVSGYLSCQKLHNKYVAEGYEGLVVRDLNKEYGIDKRDNRMIKIKEYQEDEFEILGISEGLRPEDFVFVCKCDVGEFEAKPMGNRALKEEYRNNLSNIIGKMATVKFFNYTDDGKPAQPILKVIRDYE